MPPVTQPLLFGSGSLGRANVKRRGVEASRSSRPAAVQHRVPTLHKCQPHDGRGTLRMDRSLGGGDAGRGRGRGRSLVARAGKSETGRSSSPDPERTARWSSPPRRDTGIAKETEWGIVITNESADGILEDGTTWWKKSGEDRGLNGGFPCAWCVTGGASADGHVEWKETWWEKADRSGYKELGAEKSGFNADGDTWWETWKEVVRPVPGDGSDGAERFIIEKSADKWARDKDGREWHEKWWERYSDRGEVERGSDKSGRMGSQAWWEKWGEHFDEEGGHYKWTDKWAEDGSSKWGDKWGERFGAWGVGTRSGETWRISPTGERWSRKWGEEHSEDFRVRKYGQSTSGEHWDTTEFGSRWKDIEQDYGWDEVVKDSQQLMSIRPPDDEE